MLSPSNNNIHDKLTEYEIDSYYPIDCIYLRKSMVVSRDPHSNRPPALGSLAHVHRPKLANQGTTRRCRDGGARVPSLRQG